MKEVELKFRVDDTSKLESQFDFEGPEKMVDVYYQHPSRNFQETGEWLRIRTVNGTETITYKGPRINSARTEIEVDLTEPLGGNLFSLLDFKPLTTICKSRRITTVPINPDFVGYLVICLDQVVSLGNFVELEILCKENEAKQAETILREFANDFGLTQEEKLGYAEMMLKREQSLLKGNSHDEHT